MGWTYWNQVMGVLSSIGIIIGFITGVAALAVKSYKKLKAKK